MQNFVFLSHIRDSLDSSLVFKRYMYSFYLQFGFIAYENEEGKNLFFHMSEVEGEVELQVSRKYSLRIILGKGFKHGKPPLMVLGRMACGQKSRPVGKSRLVGQIMYIFYRPLRQ